MAAVTIKEQAIGYYDFILKSGVQAERGKIAVIDTADSGAITLASTDTLLIPLGIFTADVLGDGVKTVQVKFFHEIAAYWWANDSGTPVVIADRGKPAYMLNSTTVTGDATGRTALGTVIDVVAAEGVLVYSSYPFAVDAT
jgi:hypothetical protein